MPRDIRHSISKDIWIDLNFVNCHPVILQHICIYYNIYCYYLSKYIKNKEELLTDIFDKIGCSRDDAKIFILKILNGGNINISIDWWSDLKKDFKNIATSIAEREEFKKIYNHCKKLKLFNVEASTMNNILCVYKNKCFESLYEY